jgi:hypothetical protein
MWGEFIQRSDEKKWKTEDRRLVHLRGHIRQWHFSFQQQRRKLDTGQRCEGVKDIRIADAIRPYL